MRSAIFLTWLVVGCSNATNATSDVDEWGDVQPLQQSLSFKEECEKAPVDRTITGSGGVASPTRIYGTGQCASAYIVDLVDYEYSDEASTASQVVHWGDAPPSSQDACERTFVLAYMWDMTTVPFALDAKSAYGQWVSGVNLCAVPRLDTHFIQRGRNYRYAISARQINSARTAYGTRVVSLEIN